MSGAQGSRPRSATPHRDRVDIVYADHAASSPLYPTARAVMAELGDLAGNPAALHRGGRIARALLEDAREELAELIGAHPDEVVFTSGGSEADSMALLRSAERLRTDRPGLVISTIEHPAVSGARLLFGDRAVAVEVDADGHVQPDRLQYWTQHHPAGPVGLVSLMWVNNEVGTVQPVAEATELAHRLGAWFHTDAVQALGHFDLDFHASGVDLMSVSAHKIGGPVGIGALLVRRGVELGAHGLGGGQEGRIRSGTQPVILAAGFAAAARAVVGDRQLGERLSGYRQRLVTAAAAIDGAVVNGSEPVSPSIVNIGFEGTSADDLVFLLDQQQIWCSTGSACRAGVHGPSEVLLAMGRDEAAARAGVRFSFGWSTTDADIDRIVAALADAVPRARSVPR